MAAVYTYNERQSEKKKRARKLPSSVSHELAESTSIDQMRVRKGWTAFLLHLTSRFILPNLCSIQNGEKSTVV